jgi:hypothetical protein
MTVRLPPDLYRQGKVAARRRRVSFNRLLQQSLEAALRSEERQALYQAFGMVGHDMEAEVESAFEAQAEVARSGR